MLDYLRNLGKSDEEKRQELIHAYVDGELSAPERRDFERELNSDADLRAEIEQLRGLKASMRSLPRRRVPRSFALDPARFGKPAPNRMGQAYPLLRTATAVAALMFIVALGFGVLTQGMTGGDTAAESVVMIQESEADTAVEAPAAEPAEEEALFLEEEAAEEAEIAEAPLESAAEAFEASPADEAAVETTRVVTEAEIVETEPLDAEGAAGGEPSDAELDFESAEAVEATIPAQAALPADDAPAERTAAPPTAVSNPITWVLGLLGGLFALLLILTLVARQRR